jgi:hypothetical protein
MMNLKGELVKTGNYFFRLCIFIWETDPDAFWSKPFGTILRIGIDLFDFDFEPKNDRSRKTR